MKISKIYLIIALVALVTAIPLASVLAQRDGQLKMERSNSQQLRLEIESVEKQLEKKNLETEKRNQELQKEQEKNKELEAKLQAKLKREADEKIAAERARQASVAVSAPRASGGANCDLARQLINQYDGWNKDVAYNVMVAESGCNANNQNLGDYHSFAGCRGSFGLFQINCSHGQVYDPAKNVAIAYSMYQASGWQPWSATTCKYKVACY